MTDTEGSAEHAKPFLRWAGSKRQHLAVLSSFWTSDFERYVEPFMGSASLFFAIRPEKAVLSDLNSNLVRTFIAVRDHPQAVANRLAKIRFGKRSFYRVRQMDETKLDPIDAAARFIFLNRFCFNGLYRTNQAGRFNVPYGAGKTGQLPNSADLRWVANALQACSLRNSDFAPVLKATKQGDFVYLDPPYAVGNRRVFRQYNGSSFGAEDLKRLDDCLLDMDRKGVSFVLSYASCPEARFYFKGWPRRRICIHRNIAGFAKHRRRAAEFLISNCFPQKASRN